MPDTTPTPAPKRSRALPRRWQRFLYLELNDEFSIGRCNYLKTGFFSAENAGGRVIHVWPWERVQTVVLVRDARPGGKSSLPWEGRLVVTMNEDPGNIACIPPLPNPGQTHFVGDDCPGGHADKPVNNDNNISGTSS